MSTQSRFDTNRVKILIIDTDSTVRKLLRRSLEAGGYSVVEASKSNGILKASSRAPDLIILDVEMPGLDGLQLLQILRKDQFAPVMILTANGEEELKVRALDLGAADYITKPFSVAELLARIPKALRHGLQINGEQSVFTIDDITVDLVRRSVVVDGDIVTLSPKEFDLLRLLIRRAGEAVSYAYILERLWSPRTGRKYLHATVRRLRTKLETPARCDPLIESIAGVGYRFRV